MAAADVHHQVYSNIFTGDAIKEGVMQVIYQIRPEDKPLYNISGDTTATNVQHEWLKRDRGADRFGEAGSNAAVPEGQDFMLSHTNFEDLALPSRVTNYCEIFRQLPRVTESAAAVSIHGISQLMQDQIKFRLEDFGINIEYALWLGEQSSGTETAAADTAARTLKGIDEAITTNSVAVGGAGFSLTEAQLKEGFQLCWSRGGRPQDFFSGPLVREMVNGFNAGGATKFIDVNERRIVSTVGVYEGTLQTVMLHLSRDIVDASDDAAKAYLLDRSFLKKAWLRRPFIENLPRHGGDNRARIECEVTLEFGDEMAMCEYTGIDGNN